MSYRLINRANRSPAIARLVASLGLGVLFLAGGLAGCRSTEDPSGYSRDRPPSDRLDDRDRGLQSYDIIAAADQMSASLLSVPELNEAGQQLTVVVDRARNNTVTYPQSLQIFLEQVKVELARQGRGRVQLIANRDEFRQLQSRELEQGYNDEREFGGAGARQQPPGPAGIQPDYILTSKVNDLPNRGTNFYQFVFELTDLNARTIFWTDAYTVRVAR